MQPTTCWLISVRNDRRGLSVAATAVDRRSIEHGEQSVVVIQRNRIVLVIVTPGAGHRQTEPRGGCRFHLIEDVLDAVLFRDPSAFAIDHMVPVEPGGNPLRDGRIGNHVACELFNGELIVRHVVIERLHHPIAPRPHGSRLIALVTIRVRISRDV